MNRLNNMGGILFADILFINDLALFSVSGGNAIYKRWPGREWHTLPTIHEGIAPSTTIETPDSGTRYKHTITIRLSRITLTAKDLQIARSTNVRGCLLQCTDACGIKRIIGSVEYPLFGTLNEIQGKKATDFSGYELTLTGTSIYPQLSGTEL